MKITYLDFDDIKNPLLGAGQARATYNVGEILSKMGHKVVSVCSKYPGYKDRYDNGIFYKHIGLGTNNLHLNNAAFFLALPFYLVGAKADVIIECFTAPISTLFSPIFTKIPVVVLPSMFNAKEFSKKYHLPLHWIEKFGMRFYKYMMPYSEVDDSKAKSMNPKIETKIIGQGVGREFFKIKKGKKQSILFLGRLDIAQKGIDLLLESYSKTDKKTPPLVIAGHGSDEKYVINLIDKYHLRKRVKLIGPTYGIKKYRVLSKSLFAVFPSRHDEMCLGTLEELSAGLPLLCFDIPESKWISNSCAIKVQPFDTDKFANSMEKMSKDKKSLNTMSKAAVRLASKHKWENVASETENFLRYVVDKEAKNK